MNRRTTGLSLYSYLAPARWLKVAAELVDHEWAKVCSHQWRNSAFIPAPIPVRSRRSRER